MKKSKKILSLILLVLAIMLAPCTSVEAAQKPLTEEQTLLVLINKERAANGLAPLAENAELSRAAQVRAAECSEKFSHTRPDGTEYYTVSNEVYGENLAMCEPNCTLEKAVLAWMLSPSHKANILYATSTETGFGIYKTPSGNYYIAEEFN